MTEKKEAVLDLEVPVAERANAETRRWTTTRVELWAFYVYYIVSRVFHRSFAWFVARPRTDRRSFLP